MDGVFQLIYLRNNQPEEIYVFVGDKASEKEDILQKLFKENPEDAIFKTIFTSDEIEELKQLKAPVYFINDYIHNDDNIDILDVIILVNHILSPATVELEGADLNNDEMVNILDIIVLINIILSL